MDYSSHRHASPFQRGVPDPARLPGFYRGVPSARILAFCIDAVIVGMMGGIVWVITGIPTLMTLGLLAPLQALLVASVPLLYHTVLLASPWAATFGMRRMGLEAVSIVDGGCPTLTQAAIRTVTFYGSVSLTSGLVLLVMPFNPGRRTLHDFLSGTVVLRRLPEGG